MKVCLLANVYLFLIKKVFTWPGGDALKKQTAGNPGCPRLPAFFWPIKEETKGQQSRLWGKQTFFFIWLHYGGCGEISIVFWTRKGKSLNFIQLFSMFRDWRSLKSKLRWLAIVSWLHARIARTKAQVICARSKENANVFFDFYDVNMSTKSKTDMWIFSRFLRWFFF